MNSLVLRKWMRNISHEMLLLLLLLPLVPVWCFLPLTGAAPSLTTEQLDMGVSSQGKKILSKWQVLSCDLQGQKSSKFVMCLCSNTADLNGVEEAVEFCLRSHPDRSGAVQIRTLGIIGFLPPLWYCSSSLKTFQSTYRMNASAGTLGRRYLILMFVGFGWMPCHITAHGKRNFKMLWQALLHHEGCFLLLLPVLQQHLLMTHSCQHHRCEPLRFLYGANCIMKTKKHSRQRLCLHRKNNISIHNDWLSRFGYLPPPDPVTGQLQTKEALTKAIKAMQKFGGLKETGVLDQATLGLMKTPRCSLPDVSDPNVTAGRRKRSLNTQNKWNKRHLSWRCEGRRNKPINDEMRGLNRCKIGQKESKVKRDEARKQDIGALEDWRNRSMSGNLQL
ncbi:hypothetical protein CCH79_00000758 [Gambusia affinis]|uniref:Peptidoglycan binding-like domain-containing protein n=1 Tax=Gambusia affinis TaxID=33528 RepID=A0A315VTP7_GAMAF|nr:hypothetical protein CCH79_00000758 [Gambusia affinis]